ncbi:MAG: hypothetical protein JWM31_2541 [Solirubrobacterales bacterium]|nr:hypothetical protein [Solirubrobacterales bacterium]
MPTREQLLTLLGEGHTYESAARAVGIPPGRAYLIATGRPADGNPAPPSAPVPGGEAPSSPQRLVGPPAVNPTVREDVLAWVRERAARELGSLS